MFRHRKIAINGLTNSVGQPKLTLTERNAYFHMIAPNRTKLILQNADQNTIRRSGERNTNSKLTKAKKFRKWQNAIRKLFGKK